MARRRRTGGGDRWRVDRRVAGRSGSSGHRRARSDAAPAQLEWARVLAIGSAAARARWPRRSIGAARCTRRSRCTGCGSAIKKLRYTLELAADATLAVAGGGAIAALRRAAGTARPAARSAGPRRARPARRGEVGRDGARRAAGAPGIAARRARLPRGCTRRCCRGCRRSPSSAREVQRAAARGRCVRPVRMLRAGRAPARVRRSAGRPMSDTHVREDAHDLPRPPRDCRRARRQVARRHQAPADARGRRAHAAGRARPRASSTSRSTLILTSPLVRARQTAKLVADGLDSRAGCRSRCPRSRPADAGPRRRRAGAAQPPRVDRARRATSPIWASWPPGSSARARRCAFKKGGVCRIDVDHWPPRRPGQLVWFATPKMLRACEGEAGQRAGGKRTKRRSSVRWSRPDLFFLSSPLPSALTTFRPPSPVSPRRPSARR